MPTVVAAPDKFRGTATAREVAAAIAKGAKAAKGGWTCDRAPVADGGEGLLDVLGGVKRSSRVSGPLGEVVQAEWRMKDTGGLGRARDAVAIIEMAKASGLELVGGADWNDPLRASTAGVGQLIMAAIAGGARRVIVGAGGSATTDGGQGCLDALEPRARLAGVDLVVACDVTTRFVDAARVFAPQKGASPKQVELLHRRLERLAQVYEERYGVDVRELPGSGAAGGLGGGLAAIGADLVAGFDLVAETIGLADRIERADLVIAGEGLLDDESFHGKAVGGVVSLAAELGVPVAVIVGEALPDVELPAGSGGSGSSESGLEVISLVERFGEQAATEETAKCVQDVTRDLLAGAAA